MSGEMFHEAARCSIRSVLAMHRLWLSLVPSRPHASGNIRRLEEAVTTLIWARTLPSASRRFADAAVLRVDYAITQLRRGYKALSTRSSFAASRRIIAVAHARRRRGCAPRASCQQQFSRYCVNGRLTVSALTRIRKRRYTTSHAM